MPPSSGSEPHSADTLRVVTRKRKASSLIRIFFIEKAICFYRFFRRTGVTSPLQAPWRLTRRFQPGRPRPVRSLPGRDLPTDCEWGNPRLLWYQTVPPPLGFLLPPPRSLLPPPPPPLRQPGRLPPLAQPPPPPPRPRFPPAQPRDLRTGCSRRSRLPGWSPLPAAPRPGSLPVAPASCFPVAR